MLKGSFKSRVVFVSVVWAYLCLERERERERERKVLRRRDRNVSDKLMAEGESGGKKINIFGSTTATRTTKEKNRKKERETKTKQRENCSPKRERERENIVFFSYVKNGSFNTGNYYSVALDCPSVVCPLMHS